MALAKRAPLLALDEPVSSLDPIARLEFMREVMAEAAGTGLTVIIASHVVSELERFCDWLIVLTGGHVQLAGPADDLLAAHRLLTVPRRPRTPTCPGRSFTAPTATGTPPCLSAPTRSGWRQAHARLASRAGELRAVPAGLPATPGPGGTQRSRPGPTARATRR